MGPVGDFLEYIIHSSNKPLLEGLILSVLGFPHVDLLGPPLSTGGEMAGAI